MSELNNSQEKAVTYRGGHLLIVAGPGTGKTHALTHRIAGLASELKPQERILAVTFTNKAAAEMRERLLRLGIGKDQIFVGTFHSFCWQQLQAFSALTGLAQDLKLALPQEIEEASKNLWPAKTAGQRREALEEISRFKSGPLAEVTPSEVTAYNNFLRQHGWLEFDDLLCETVRLLKMNQQAREQLSKVYRFICVDEYQDINAIQQELLTLLVADGASLTAIGDPNQAIYGFRGSDVKFFESFQKDFPGAQIMALTENYRSAANLLKASGQLIAANKRFSVSELTARIYTQGRLMIHEAPTAKAEAEFVVHQIEKMVGGTSMFSLDSGRVQSDEGGQYSFAGIAVLYRMNSQRHLLEEALLRSGIPYRVSEQTLDKDALFDAPPIDNGMEKVNLLTLHAAKGLEFPAVFIVGCEENLIPLKIRGRLFDPEEERRLFYVGMTRAKERLFLVHAKQRSLYGRMVNARPSPFLSDIQEELKSYEQSRKQFIKKPKSSEEQMSLFGEE